MIPTIMIRHPRRLIHEAIYCFVTMLSPYKGPLGDSAVEIDFDAELEQVRSWEALRAGNNLTAEYASLLTAKCGSVLHSLSHYQILEGR
jgi:hypothetical protein